MTPRMREGMVMAVTIELCTTITNVYGPVVGQIGEGLKWDVFAEMEKLFNFDDEVTLHPTIRLETLCLRSKQTAPKQ